MMSGEEALRRLRVEMEWRKLSTPAKVARVAGNLLRLVVPWVVTGLLVWVSVHLIMKLW